MSTWREKPTSPDDLRAAIQSYGATPDRIETIPPRVRRNFTQGANGLWRAEFSVESYHDPSTPQGRSNIEVEDAWVSVIVRDTLAALNHKGPPEEAPVPT
jgi:hypothetical protein